MTTIANMILAIVLGLNAGKCTPHRLDLGPWPGAPAKQVETTYMLGPGQEFCGMQIEVAYTRYSPRRDKNVTSLKRYYIPPGQDLVTSTFAVYWSGRLLSFTQDVCTRRPCTIRRARLFTR